ncbi:pseudouridine synthase [Algoriphagus namhaensis]|uniref:tRNA pseudouridine synthase C n=1 Tax=Algoriphagus namhaensis TaxID=915353 RepID=A0ABV8ATX1_9BACT
MRPLHIIYEDESLVAINKPSGLLVHRTKIAAEETEFALQILRDQIGSWVSPIHRLDRPTSGVLLFSKNPELMPSLKQQFEERKAEKVYWAICRGIPAQKYGKIDYALTSEYSNNRQEALSNYKVISECEIPFDTTGRYPTSRYSLIEVKPETGRTHQIRKHLAHLRHYIIGDKKHGDNKQNHFFEQQFGLKHLLLHSKSLSITHPISGNQILFTADPPVHFVKITTDLSLSLPKDASQKLA